MLKTNRIINLLILFFCGFPGQLSAQSPEKFNYQAMARDASGNVLVSQAVSLRISILQGTLDGNAVYVETHTTTSNAHGQLTVTIGGGTPVSGTFSTIGWGSQPHFMKTEMDAAGGASYTLMGTTQLLSVPYALYAKEAGSGGTTYTAGTGIDITGTVVSNTQPNATHTGDATGSSALTVERIRGRTVSASTPATGQVLKWHDTEWALANDNNTALPGGSSSQTLRYDGSNWVGSSLLANNGTGLAIGTVPLLNTQLNLYRPPSSFGAGYTNIYAKRDGSFTAANGGTGWTLSQVDAAIKGYSNYGNNYSAGVAGYGYLDYSNSYVCKMK